MGALSLRLRWVGTGLLWFGFNGGSGERAA